MSYTCERCGKFVEDTNKFGSGRFCSRACANARNHSEETKEKIRKGLNKETKCFCQYCGKEFNTLTAKASHEKLCKSNPNRLENPSTQYKDKLQRKVVLHRYGENKKDKVVLDITYAELERYKESHTVCEICGRSVTETIKWKSKYAAKTLCIDHDHKNNKFRGMLCHNCNTKLGWYEIYQGKINEYLSK